MAKFCANCGNELNDGADFCVKCGKALNASNSNANTSTGEGKSKIAAGILGILLGALGVHNFYLGFTGKAVAQLLITILSFGILSFISGLWGLIEGIMILTGSINKDAKGNPLVG